MGKLKFINITSISKKPISLQDSKEIKDVNKYLMGVERKLNLYAFLNKKDLEKIEFIKIIGYKSQPYIENEEVKSEYKSILEEHGIKITNNGYRETFIGTLLAADIIYEKSKDKTKSIGKK